MPHRSRTLLVAVVASALTVVSAGSAHAHFLDSDSVDGNEIRYQDASKWDDSHNNAISQWEGLAGGVSIAPDSSFTINDLQLSDYSANDGYCGYWKSSSGEDDLRLNDNYYNGASTTNRRACTIHEWGHAHRLAHSYNDQVMDDCPVSACGSAYTSPQSHDRNDYHQIW